MNTFTQIQDPVSPPSYKPKSELDGHHLNISNNENAISAIDAAQDTLGNTSVIAAVLVFVAYTSTAEGGMGIAITSSLVAISAVSALSFLTLLISIPLSIKLYKENKKETEEIILEIKKSELARKKYRENLFFNLLMMRCYYDNNLEKFNQFWNTLKPNNAEVDHDKLFVMINDIYHKLQVTSLNEIDEKNNLNNNAIFSNLSNLNALNDSNIKKTLFKKLSSSDSFNQKFDECFKDIETLSKVNYNEAIWHGMRSFFTIFSGMFGLITTYATIFLAAGFCAAISATGWGLIAAGIILGCMAFSAFAAMSKHKNCKRKTLNAHIESRNANLKSDTKNIIIHLKKQKCELDIIKDLKINKLNTNIYNLNSKINHLDDKLSQATQVEADHVKEIMSYKKNVSSLQEQHEVDEKNNKALSNALESAKAQHLQEYAARVNLEIERDEKNAIIENLQKQIKQIDDKNSQKKSDASTQTIATPRTAFNASRFFSQSRPSETRVTAATLPTSPLHLLSKNTISKASGM